MSHSLEVATRLGSVQKQRRLLLRLAALPLLPLMLVTASTWRDDSIWHEGIEHFGLLLILICLLGRATCTLYIGGRKSAELVTIGPYSVSRNPLYFFSLLGTTGAGLLYGSIAVGCFFGCLYFLAFDRLIRREERFLGLNFPVQFADYCSVTPRWLPRWRQWKSVDEIVVRPKLVFNTLRDASVFVLTFPLFEAVEWLQLSGVLPVYLRLP